MLGVWGPQPFLQGWVFMLGLPSKPWKHVRILELGGSRYKLILISPSKTQEEFRDMVEHNLKACLAESDEIEEIFREEMSLFLSIDNLESFRRKLVLCNIMIEDDEI